MHLSRSFIWGEYGKMKPGVLAAALLFFLTTSLGNALLCYNYQVTYVGNQTVATCSPVKMLCQESDTCAAYAMMAWNQNTILSRSCLEQFRCGSMTLKTVHEIEYNIQSVFCCDTDLCNTANALRVSILSTLSLLILWVVH